MMTQNRLAEIRQLRHKWRNVWIGSVLTELLRHIEELGNVIVDLRRERDEIYRKYEAARKETAHA